MIFSCEYILLSRLLYITEGKYWNQLKKFRKFRDVLSSGSHETGSKEIKVTASNSPKPGPHIHIFFFNSEVTGTRRNGDKEWKSMYVCDAFLLASISPCISKVHGHFWLKFGMVTSIYEALMLLNYCGDWGRWLGARTKLLGVSNWRKLLGSKVLGICLKLSLAKKIFPQNHPHLQKIQKND